MNILKTLGPHKAQSLPYTVADLMRMSRASQEAVKEKQPNDPVSSLDRYNAISANPIFTYSPKGRMASRQKSPIGSQVDVRA